MKHRVACTSALFAIFLFVFPLTSKKAFAEAWFWSNPQSFGQTLQDAESSNRIQMEGYQFATGVFSMNTLTCLIGGCGKNPQSVLHYSKSALASINGLIGSMYTTPPANTYAAIQDFGRSLGFLPKQAYAQGVGFSGLAPLIPIWKVFRNIAYVLLALVMIVIGFMVMFRKKIDPKTVVTVQNALPRIVLTLLLITFSYAIVGVLIDVMYLVLALAYELFRSTGYLPENRTAIAGLNLAGATVRDVILSGNLFQAFHIIFPSNVVSIQNMANTILTGGDFLSTAFLTLTVISPLTGFIIALALLFIFIRLFILFLSSYVQIVLSLIFGPIQLLVGAIPGTDGFGGWIKNLVANLAVFPIAGVMFMLSIVFAEAGNKVGGGPGNTFWAPPYYTLANSSVASITALFSIGVLMMIPSLAGALKKAIKAQGVPAGPGAILAPLGGAVGTGMQLTSTAFQLKQLGAGELITRFIPGRKTKGP